MMPIRPTETIRHLIRMSTYRGATAGERSACRDAADLLTLWSEPHILTRLELSYTGVGYLELREVEGFTPVIITVTGSREKIQSGLGRAILNTGTGRFTREIRDYNSTWRVWDAIPEKTSEWL